MAFKLALVKITPASIARLRISLSDIWISQSLPGFQRGLGPVGFRLGPSIVCDGVRIATFVSSDLAVRVFLSRLLTRKALFRSAGFECPGSWIWSTKVLDCGETALQLAKI